MTTAEAVSVIDGKIDRLIRVFETHISCLEARVDAQAAEIARLRLKITQPHLEELSKKEAAADLGCSERSIQTYSSRWARGDRTGLQHGYRAGRSGREWYTTRAWLGDFQRHRRAP